VIEAAVESPASVVVDVGDLAPGHMRAFEAGGRKLLVCRVGEEFFALENHCPHVAIQLDQGRLEGCVLECPLHGGKLDVRDGSPQGHPIRRPATIFSVRPVEGGLEITLGD
jgi:nitrite reductase/ring-hydroxylating ferredoxin subunit